MRLRRNIGGLIIGRTWQGILRVLMEEALGNGLRMQRRPTGIIDGRRVDGNGLIIGDQENIRAAADETSSFPVKTLKAMTIHAAIIHAVLNYSIIPEGRRMRAALLGGAYASGSESGLQTLGTLTNTRRARRCRQPFHCGVHLVNDACAVIP